MVLHLGGDTYVNARNILAIVGAKPRGCIVYAREDGELRALPTELGLRAVGRRVQALEEEALRIRRMMG